MKILTGHIVTVGLAMLLASGMVWAQPQAGSNDTLNLQPVHVSKKDSASVKWKYNHLEFPASHTAFDNLYSGISAVGTDPQAQLRILHIGGSHVQAGHFSGRMRSNLRQFSPQRPVGRGILFPFTMMNTNGPKDWNYEWTGTWTFRRNIEHEPSLRLGISGASVNTNDPAATISISTANPFESLLLYGNNLNDSLPFTPLIIAGTDTISPFIYTERSNEYVYSLPQPVQECQLAFRCEESDSTSGFAVRGFVTDPYADGLVYTESGINGAALPSWLRCAEFENELQVLAPDLVIFAIGINDANVVKFNPEEFKQNYRKLIERIRRCNPDCAFLFVTNNDCYLRVARHKKTFNKNTAIAEKAFIELAQEFDGAVWNAYQIMGGYGSCDKWVRAKLMQTDRVHFTARGYELLGDLLFNSILEDYLKWKEAGCETSWRLCPKEESI